MSNPTQAKTEKKKQPEDVSVPENKGRSYTTWIHMALLTACFLIAYLACISEKIDLGGDNICYHILGKALASGAGYVNIYSPLMLPENHFPPGYPFLISLFMRLGIEDIQFFVWLNGALTLASILLFYKLIKMLGLRSNLAFTVGLFLVFNVSMLSFATVNMSEIPYVFYSILALFSVAKLEDAKSPYNKIFFALMTISVIAAFYTRTSGIALILAIAGYWALRKKWSNLSIFVISVFLGILPWQLRSQALGGNSYIKQFLLKNPYAAEQGAMGWSDLWTRIGNNIVRYISVEIPSAITGQILETGKEPGMRNWIIGLVVLLFIIIAIVKLARSVQRAPIILYIIFSAGILILWPDVWTGWRFLLPVVPLIIFFAAYGVDSVVGAFAQKRKIPWNIYILCFLVLLTIPSLKVMSEKAKEPYPINFQNYFDLAQWAGSNTPENSIICCRKPELFYLFSNRKSMAYPFVDNSDSIMRSMEYAKVDYVVVDQLGFSSTRKYLVPAMTKNATRFRSVKVIKNPDTYLFRFMRKPEPVKAVQQ